MTIKHKFKEAAALFNDDAVTFVSPEDMQAIADETGGEIYTCADTRTKRMEVDVDGERRQFACEPDAPKKTKAASKPATKSAEQPSGEFINVPKAYAPLLLDSLKRQREELDSAISNLEASL